MTDEALKSLNSPNGFRSKEWGASIFWPVYHGLANEEQATSRPRKLVEFYLASPCYLLPCVYCRRSYLDFLCQPRNTLSDCFRCTSNLRSRSISRQKQQAQIEEEDNRDPQQQGERQSGKSISDWMVQIHNCVNSKLGKPLFQGSCHVMLNQAPWQSRFWDFLFLQALDFPLNVTPEVREMDRDVSRRYRTCIFFFDQLKDFLPDGEFRQAWTFAYFQLPPTPSTFASRQALVEWLYSIYVLAAQSEKHTNNNNIPSLEQLLAYYATLRASSCTSVVKAGETGCH